MKLKEFLQKYHFTYERVAKHCGISPTTIWKCADKDHKPSQKVALKLETFTKGLVTVKELRGRDDREPFNPDNTED